MTEPYNKKEGGPEGIRRRSSGISALIGKYLNDVF